MNYTISNVRCLKIIVVQFKFGNFLCEHPVDKSMIAKALLGLRTISKKVHVCDSLKMRKNSKSRKLT